MPLIGIVLANINTFPLAKTNTQSRLALFLDFLALESRELKCPAKYQKAETNLSESKVDAVKHRIAELKEGSNADEGKITANALHMDLNAWIDNLNKKSASKSWGR